MSVESESYLILGSKIKNFEWEIHEEFLFPVNGKAKGKMGILHDMTSGSFTLAGKCIASPGKYDGFDLIDINKYNTTKNIRQVAEWLNKNKIKFSNIKMWLVTDFR